MQSRRELLIGTLIGVHGEQGTRCAALLAPCGCAARCAAPAAPGSAAARAGLLAHAAQAAARPAVRCAASLALLSAVPALAAPHPCSVGCRITHRRAQARA